MRFPKRLAVSQRKLRRALRRTRPAERLTDYPLITTEKLRFADTDRHGHISNAVFAVCCQNARMELLYDEQRVQLPPATQLVIGRFELEFRAEMHWPGTVRIGTRVACVGRCSVELAQALFVGERCVAVARSTVVLIDVVTRRPLPLPDDMHERLQGFAGPSRRPEQWVRGAWSAVSAWAARP
jgi:acyl-CoA thioester hydrolase